MLLILPKEKDLFKKEIKFFIFVGILATLTDFVVYILLKNFLLIDLSKAIGFMSGALISYFGNRELTFSHATFKRGSFLRYAIVYILSMTLNIIVNKLTLTLLSNYEAHIIGAFFIATSSSVIFNFIGMKFFVFRKIR